MISINEVTPVTAITATPMSTPVSMPAQSAIVQAETFAPILYVLTYDTLDEAIRRTEQLVAKLQQVKQGLLHDLLTRGLDVAQVGHSGALAYTTGYLDLLGVADGRKIDAPRLVDVKAHHMAEAFTRAANWKRFDKREGKWLQTDCPHDTRPNRKAR